jgi:hypothetical protein
MHARTLSFTSCRIADNKLAYNLLHADYIVKKHDLDALRLETSGQQAQILEMQETYLTAKRQIEAANALAEKYRQKWERGRMYTADLESGNRRQALRIREVRREEGGREGGREGGMRRGEEGGRREE